MTRFLQSPTGVGTLGALLYVSVTVLCWPKLELARDVSPDGSGTRRSGPSWEYSNPELEMLTVELTNERSALAERARQLNEFEARLRSEQMELTVVTQAVHRLRQDLDAMLVRVDNEEVANLKKLARVYANMGPEGSVAILRQLDESTIVKVLIYLKEDEIAPILEAFVRLGEAESKMAASIAERLRVAVFRPPPNPSRR
ncbi:MAG: hypothetical protein KF833_00005 [Verrucomicrobiae bacterium]|nr:hypothetical protein [Verrucomicrobiae bacterium]